MDRGQLITLINENVGNESLNGTDSDHSLFFARLLLPHSLTHSLGEPHGDHLAASAQHVQRIDPSRYSVDSLLRVPQVAEIIQTPLLLSRHVGDPIGNGHKYN